MYVIRMGGINQWLYILPNESVEKNRLSYSMNNRHILTKEKYGNALL